MEAVVEADFLTCLKPFQTTLKLFGLETFQFTSKEINYAYKYYKVKRSYAATFYLSLLLVTVLSLHVINTHTIFGKLPAFFTHASINAMLLSANLMFISVLVSLIGMVVNHKTRLQIINSFMEVDQILRVHSQDSYRKWSKRSTACIMLAFAVLGATVGVQSSLNQSISDYAYTVEVFFRFMVLAVVMEYVNLVLLVRQRAQALNSELRGRTRLQRASLAGGQSRVHMAPSDVPGRGHRHMLAPGGSLQHTETVCALSAVYGKLHRITCLINSAYGWPVMFCILFCVSSLTTVLHFGMQLNFKSLYAGQHENSVFAMTSVGLWTLFYTAESIAMIRVCSATRKEVSVTKNEIQRFLLTPGLDGRAVSALREFSQHISSREIEFSAAGFFNIDMTLLASMAWTVLSYLLVLIQFDYMK